MTEERTLLLISEHPEEGWGGPVHYISILIPVLRRSGFQVRLLADGGLSPRLLEFLEENNVRLLPRYGGLLRTRKLLIRLPRILRYPIESVLIATWLKLAEVKPHRVIVSLCSPGRYLWPHGLLGQASFIFHSEPAGSRHVLAGIIFRCLIGKKATFVGVSAWVSQSLQEVWGLRGNSVRQVTIKNPSTRRDTAPPYTPEDRRVVLMVGAANEFKNPWFWLAVAKNVVENGPAESIIFRWVGDGPLLPSMREWVREHKLSTAIELPGYSEDLAKHYEEARLYFQCSLRETSSFSAIDAMSFGIPLVVSRVGGLDELVNNERNGLKFRITSHQETAILLSGLYNDPERLKKLSRNAIRVSREEYSHENWQRAVRENILQK